MLIDIKLSDVAHFGREPDIAWWPKAELTELTFLAQAHLIQRPGTYGLAACADTHCTYHLDGIRRTARALDRRREDPFQQLTVLRLAVLESSRNRGGGGCGPAVPAACLLQTELEQHLGLVPGEPGSIWQSLNTSLLPPVPLRGDNNCSYHPHLEMWRDELATPEACLAEIDRQVALVLANWQLVRVTYAADASESEAVLADYREAPYTLQVLQREKEAQEHRDAERAAWAADRAREAAATAALKAKHPRLGQWTGLPNQEVTELVWAHQSTALAQEFGVSDTWIRKDCKRRGIARPPQGYWLRADKRHKAV